MFVYEFSHPTEVPGFPECSGSACHTAELPFVFDNVRVGATLYSGTYRLYIMNTNHGRTTSAGTPINWCWRQRWLNLCVISIVHTTEGFDCFGRPDQLKNEHQDSVVQIAVYMAVRPRCHPWCRIRIIFVFFRSGLAKAIFSFWSPSHDTVVAPSLGKIFLGLLSLFTSFSLSRISDGDGFLRRE